MKTQKVLGWGMAGMIGLVLIWAVVVNQTGPRPTTSSPAAPACDRQQAEKAVTELFEKNVLYTIKQGAGTKGIYVMELWYQFPIDWKQTLDRALLCIAGGEPGGEPVIHYLDAQTGKLVASGGYLGFRIE
jgi:hypothetical protein